ncbi:MAG: signal peptidase I [Gammaproteobacteria bacterium]|nr:signal peptidase I [Gammaproteobacteria bacterium]
MNFDFELALSLAVVVSGCVWALDAMFWAPNRKIAAHGASDVVAKTPEGAANKEPLLVEYARSFFPVLLVVLVLRSFIFEPFRIPSGSMMPTLLVGDFILVKKYAYGVRLPVLNTRLTEGEAPKTGDIAVFRFPLEPSLDYIKRIVGLPGDRIGYYNKTLYINGKAMDQADMGVYRTEKNGGRRMNGASLRKETLADELQHDILVQLGAPGIEGESVVPAGHYFVVGDNRDNSNDSRYWGFVPEENLVGKAVRIWMHWDWDGTGLDVGRIGQAIK